MEDEIVLEAKLLEKMKGLEVEKVKFSLGMFVIILIQIIVSRK